MARYRSNMALRPVHRIKHVVDSSATITAAVNHPITLINSKDAPVLANVTEVETGAKVNGIYLKVEVASNEAQDVGAIPNVYLAIVKDPGGSIGSSIVPNTVGSNDNKRFVIHQEMIMLDNKLGGNPRVLFNGVIAIPRGYRRFGPNDVLICRILAPALNIALCIQCHYKEFR